MKLYIPSINESMCSDVTVICGPPEYYKDRKDVILNPSFVVEVLSPSTAAYDKATKSEFYRRISTLKAIILVDSVKPYAQVQSRTEGGPVWTLQEVTGLPDQAHKPLDAAPDKRATSADLAASGESVVRGSSNVRFGNWNFTLGEIYADILDS